MNRMLGLRSEILRAVVLTIALLGLGTAQAASFDCAKASHPSEKMICASPLLSTLDEQMAAAYGKARRESPNAEALKQEQMQWLKEARACTNEPCMMQAYQTRLMALGFGIAPPAAAAPAAAPAAPEAAPAAAPAEAPAAAAPEAPPAPVVEAPPVMHEEASGALGLAGRMLEHIPGAPVVSDDASTGTIVLVVILCLVLLVVSFVISFLPTIIAFMRGSEKRIPILLINIFLSWTVIGWWGALIWAFVSAKRSAK